MKGNRVCTTAPVVGDTDADGKADGREELGGSVVLALELETPEGAKEEENAVNDGTRD